MLGVQCPNCGVADEVVGEIGPGLCVLLGIARTDEAADAERLAGQIARLRIFENEDGKFDRSVVDTEGAALVVSQFTLIAETTKGNRPSFTEAAEPKVAEQLYQAFCAALQVRACSLAVDRDRGPAGRLFLAADNAGCAATCRSNQADRAA